MISEEKADVVADEVLLDACLYAHARSSIAPLVCRESEDCTISWERGKFIAWQAMHVQCL